jgi:hypothetical protein
MQYLPVERSSTIPVPYHTRVESQKANRAQQAGDASVVGVVLRDCSRWDCYPFRILFDSSFNSLELSILLVVVVPVLRCHGAIYMVRTSPKLDGGVP